MNIFIFYIALHVLSVTGKIADYCTVKCIKGIHTICKLKHNCGAGPECTKFQKYKLTEGQIQELLDKHNEFRNIVALGEEKRGADDKPQPSASNMAEMVWDLELAFEAQCYANQCKFQHDDCRNDLAGTEIGQNLGQVTGSSDVLLSDNIQRMYEEVVDFHPSEVSKFTGKSLSKTGHYTQIIWAQTTRLGCGISKFEQEGHPQTLLVCHYGPSGNFRGRPVYLKGKPCSACPEGSKCHKVYKGLCTTPTSKSVVPKIEHIEKAQSERSIQSEEIQSTPTPSSNNEPEVRLPPYTDCKLERKIYVVNGQENNTKNIIDNYFKIFLYFMFIVFCR